MQLVFNFDKPTAKDMHVLIFIESPTLVTLNKEGKVTIDG